MQEYLKDSAAYYYSDLLMILCAMTCTLIGFINRNKYEELRWLFLYPLSTLIQTFFNFLIAYVFEIFKHKELNEIINYSINIFLIVEFFSLFIFFYKSILIEMIKRILILVLLLYTSIIFYSWIFSNNIYNYPFDLFFIQALFVLILAMTRLIDLFKNIPKRTLLNEPSFWIIIGSLLYFLCTLPIYIAKEFIFNYEGFVIENGMYSINFICYSIFFLLIIRAYLCKPTAQQ